MKHLTTELHVIICAGTPEDLRPRCFQPFDHARFLQNIAAYRLPPPKFWAVLHTTAEELADPLSSINGNLDHYEPTPGDGVDLYLKAAVDNLLTEDMRRALIFLSRVDYGQYPDGYEMILTAQSFKVHKDLEDLDLIHIPFHMMHPDRSHEIHVKPTERGELTCIAAGRFYA